MKKYALPLGIGAGLVIGGLLGLVTHQVVTGFIFGVFLGLGLTAGILAWGEKPRETGRAAPKPLPKASRKPNGGPAPRSFGGATPAARGGTVHRETYVEDRYDSYRSYDDSAAVAGAVGAAVLADELAREEAEAVYVEPEPERVYFEPEPVSAPDTDWGGGASSSSDDSSSSDSGGDSGSSD